jgi:hypothetical protein
MRSRLYEIGISSFFATQAALMIKVLLNHCRTCSSELRADLREAHIGSDGILWYLVFECKINLAVSSFVLFIFFSTNLFLKVEFHSQVKIRMGQPEAVNGKWTDNTMVKREKRKQ